MPRFVVRMERPVMEFRSVCVEAADEDDAKVQALSADFDEMQLDDWDTGDPGPAEVYEVEAVADTEPLTPIIIVHSADKHGQARCGAMHRGVMVTEDPASVTCADCRE